MNIWALDSQYFNLIFNRHTNKQHFIFCKIFISKKHNLCILLGLYLIHLLFNTVKYFLLKIFKHGTLIFNKKYKRVTKAHDNANMWRGGGRLWTATAGFYISRHRSNVEVTVSLSPEEGYMKLSKRIFWTPSADQLASEYRQNIGLDQVYQDQNIASTFGGENHIKPRNYECSTISQYGYFTNYYFICSSI